VLAKGKSPNICTPLFAAGVNGGLRRDCGSAIENLRPSNLEGMARPLGTLSQAIRLKLYDHGAAVDQEWCIKDEFLFALQNARHTDAGSCEFSKQHPCLRIPAGDDRAAPDATGRLF
jgi:hypothetical protein